MFLKSHQTDGFDPLDVLPKKVATRNVPIRSQEIKSEQHMCWFGSLEVQNVLVVLQDTHLINLCLVILNVDVRSSTI